MAWTRLFHVKDLTKAFARVIPSQPINELVINKRYQAMIRKEFRLNGVPWIYNLQEPKLNPRDKKPKGTKHAREKQLRIAKIQKLLKENQVKELEWRQNRLNNRPLKGVDEQIAKTLPSWIKPGVSDVPSYMRNLGKKSSSYEGDDEY